MNKIFRRTLLLGGVCAPAVLGVVSCSGDNASGDNVNQVIKLDKEMTIKLGVNESDYSKLEKLRHDFTASVSGATLFTGLKDKPMVGDNIAVDGNNYIYKEEKYMDGDKEKTVSDWFKDGVVTKEDRTLIDENKIPKFLWELFSDKSKVTSDIKLSSDPEKPFYDFERVDADRENEGTALAESMANLVILGDNDAMAEARKENSAFRGISISDISHNNTGNELFDFNFASPDFYDGLWQSVTIPGQDKYIGVPMKSQAKSLYFLRSFVDKTKNIFATVPKVGGGFDTQDTGIKATFLNITKFLSDSGNEASETGFDNVDITIDGWKNSGPIAMYQRIGSIMNSLNPQRDPQNDGAPNMGSGFGVDMALPYGVISSLGNIYSAENGQIDDTKLKDIFDNKLTNESTYAEELWKGYYGYFQTNNDAEGNRVNVPLFTDPKYNGEGGLGEMLKNKHSVMVSGHQWMHGTVLDFSPKYSNYVSILDEDGDEDKYKSTRHNSTFAYEGVSLPMPFSESVTSSWAIYKKTTTSKKQFELVKSFMRFMYNNDSSFGGIVGSKDAMMNKNDYSKQVDKSRESWDIYGALPEGETKKIDPYNINGYGSVWLPYTSRDNKIQDTLTSWTSPYLASLLGGRKNPDSYTSVEAVDSPNGLTGTFRESSSQGYYAIYKAAFQDNQAGNLDKNSLQDGFNFTSWFNYMRKMISISNESIIE